MIQKDLTAIRRASLFSPNHRTEDYDIFAGTISYLCGKGYQITLHTEYSFLDIEENPGRVFTMLREKASIRHLKTWEKDGCRSVNSSLGIENCGRERMTRLLLDNGIPYPDSIIVDSDNKNIAALLQERDITACWLKRGDYHAIYREDITYARNHEEAQSQLADYAARGIKRVVINKHIKGDLIKFYGVAGSSFFHWLRPFGDYHSKFGHEVINGEARGYKVREDKLRDICQKAAEILHLTVYGGDCILMPRGVMYIIDFNDWPSFAPCRKEAIPAIGDAIARELFP